MLKWALIFAVVALIAGAMGFGGIAGAAAGIAKILFFIFLVGFIIFLAGCIWGASVAGVPSVYIGIGALILLGIGIFSAVGRTRSKDPS